MSTILADKSFTGETIFLMDRSRFRGHIFVLIAMLFFAFNLPAVKGLLSVGFSVAQIVFLKIVFGAVFFWICSWFGDRDKITLRDHLYLVLTGITGVLLLQFFLIGGLSLTSVVDVGIIFSFSSGLFILPFFFQCKQRLVYKLAGICLAVAGVLLIVLAFSFTGSLSSRSFGNLYILLATFSFVVCLWFIRKLLYRYRLVTILKWMFFWSAVVSIFFLFDDLLSVALIRSLYLPQVQIILLFILLFPVIVFYCLLLVALRRISTEAAVMYSYLVPVVASIISLGVGQTVLEWIQPVSELSILVGTLLILHASDKEQRRWLHG